jgi:hypothetical protein
MKWKNSFDLHFCLRLLASVLIVGVVVGVGCFSFLMFFVLQGFV